jgi:quinol monooxygenase YgiN
MSDNFVAVVWEARAKPCKEAEMKSFLTGVVTASRHDPGCIDYDFYEVDDDPGLFVAYERWVNRTALDAHLSSERMQRKGPQLLELMEGSIGDGLRILRVFRPPE